MLARRIKATPTKIEVLFAADFVVIFLLTRIKLIVI